MLQIRLATRQLAWTQAKYSPILSYYRIVTTIPLHC